MGAITLQSLFQKAYPAYERTHPLPTYVRKAAHAIMQCRTAALGGHVQACPEGHVQRIWYNSCRHRACPQCAFMEIERWLEKQRARLLACDHYHVIFTIPHDLNGLWLKNTAVMTKLLFQAVRDTLMSLLADPKYLGAQPGIIAALHTWSQTLALHPHVHCLVTGGGLSPQGEWKAVRHGFLLPVRVVMAVFRGKFLAALRSAWERGTLELAESLSAQAFANLLRRLGHPKKTRWHVHIQERYAHGTGVATYLARYMRGGPLQNGRIVGYDGEKVSFRYGKKHARTTDSGGPQQQMSLPVEDFIQRLLQHVPQRQMQVVRSWGVYHALKAEALGNCRKHLGQGLVVKRVRQEWQRVCGEVGDLHPERCPVCGQRLVCTGPLWRGGVSPPESSEERAA